MGRCVSACNPAGFETANTVRVFGQTVPITQTVVMGNLVTPMRQWSARADFDGSNDRSVWAKGFLEAAGANPWRSNASAFLALVCVA
jgi:hypothetical protein